MRILIFMICAVSMSLTSCKDKPDKVSSYDSSEEFKNIDASILNSRLANMVDENVSVELIAEMLFLPNAMVENNNIQLHKRELENGNSEVVVVHKNIRGGLFVAEKFVITLSSNKSSWKILALRKNWKCRDEQIWGVSTCV